MEADLTSMPVEPSGSASDLLCGSAASTSTTPDRSFTSSSIATRSFDAQSQATLKSEEYRLLFRLPADEVLLQDFNCALQENILLQGHLYVFTSFICFYSNIFGFETKKIIHYREITGVKRAKTAGIFPTAIEIYCGEKKIFFASFLSRDEAFRLIDEGCSQQNSVSNEVGETQAPPSAHDVQENGHAVQEFDGVGDDNELRSSTRREDTSLEIVQNVTEDESVALRPSGSQQDVVDNVDMIEAADSSLSLTKASIWHVDNIEAPEISNDYTRIAEATFPIKVEDFFKLFFSDDAVKFVENFHLKCGDKDFKCFPWVLHEKMGHTRNVSFQHPIKIYFGAKFGCCQEQQKFRVYRNSHLVIETAQDISDVPYSDYFCVKGLWDVTRHGEGPNERSILNVYLHVAFSKKTVFKGKIVQSTLEECREAYALWIEMAHELLKNTKTLEGSSRLREARTNAPGDLLSQNAEKMAGDASNGGSARLVDGNIAICGPNSPSGRESVNGAPNTLSRVGESVNKFLSVLRQQNHGASHVLAISFFAIFLMQVSILVLLSRPQTGAVVPSGGGDEVAWMARRVQHMKDDVYFVETQLDRLRREHEWLKAQLKRYDKLRNSK